MTTRRNFINGLIGLSITSVLPFSAHAKNGISVKKESLLPKALKKGDTIGLIAPGYTFTKNTLNETISILEQLGYKVYYTPRILGQYGYFSNTDTERAADINHMFTNPLVDAILCLRGGYGCTRIMDLINYDVIAKNPKALIGFSDVTALLNGIYKITGLITFHGPLGSTLNDDYSQKCFKKMLRKPLKKQSIENPKILDTNKTNPEYERYVITPGKAEGRLCGGSLSLINALVGTPYEIDFTNKIVCIEDVEEAPYRIDRMLTQLIEGETFNNAAGIVFGVCAGCNQSNDPNSFNLKEVIMDRIQPLGIPALYGMGFGHIKQNFTFPIGIKASFNTEVMSIEILEETVK
ncbi:S66 peptidase family protein [Maribacter sp. CXY002]|uniref:S66 peptidase family protein n=1 Tax=Maribacter luteocoastalis TaxID=3407671 RepID=UPI003B67E074